MLTPTRQELDKCKSHHFRISPAAAKPTSIRRISHPVYRSSSPIRAEKGGLRLPLSVSQDHRCRHSSRAEPKEAGGAAEGRLQTDERQRRSAGAERHGMGFRIREVGGAGYHGSVVGKTSCHRGRGRY